MAKLKLIETHKRVIEDLYNASSWTRDDLPYTDEFDRLYAEFLIQTQRRLTRHEFWKALSSAGKASRLNRKERRQSRDAG